MRGDTLAEGIAVKAPGQITQPIVRQLVDDIVLVSEQEIEHAVSLLINIEKTVVEGAGAAGLAAVLKRARAVQGAHPRSGAVRRQHRHAAAGERADAGARPRGPAYPARHRSRRPARHARQGRQHRWARPAPTSSRSTTSACSRDLPAKARAARGRDRDARPRAPEGDGGQAQGRRFRGRGPQQSRRGALMDARGEPRRAGDAADWRELNRANWDERVPIHLGLEVLRSRAACATGAAGSTPSRKRSSGRWRACACCTCSATSAWIR